jgi:hypothetical protein
MGPFNQEMSGSPKRRGASCLQAPEQVGRRMRIGTGDRPERDAGSSKAIAAWPTAS